MLNVDVSTRVSHMINVDVIKAAYRQTKDGFVVTFAIHPQDQHDALALADIGSQWNMKLTPLDENGNAGGDHTPANAGTVAPAREAGPVAAAPASRLTRQAAIACNDTLFWVFLTESGMPVSDAKQAAVAVRMICHVESRKAFGVGTAAGNRWETLYSKFLAWRDVPIGVA